MSNKKIVTYMVELLVLLVAVAGLYHVWKTRPPLPTQTSGDNDEDDLKYKPLVPVNVAPIERKTLRAYLDAYGSVEPEPAIAGKPAAVVNLSSPSIQLVTAVNCVEGQQVKQGQALFALNNENVTSPIDGTVTLLAVHAGEVALPRRTAVQVTDLNRLVIAASVPASQLIQVHVGQEAEIEISGATTQPARLKSQVNFIDPQVDPKTGLGSVDLRVPAETKLRLGDFATVHIVTMEHRDCLVVPAESIVNDDAGEPGVSVVRSDHETASREPVKVGLRDGDDVEISRDDLQPGTLIVTKGAAALKDVSGIAIKK